jgi:hypothetical protein
MMKVINPIVVVVCAVFMTLSFSEAAQQGAKTPGKDPDKLTPQAKNAAEANDFNAIGANNDAAARLVLAETFRQKYPVSQLLGELHGLRMAALLNLKRFNEAIDELKAAVEWGDKYYNEQYTKAINKNSPALQELLRYKDNNELDNYRRMLDAAQAAQNVAVTVAMGEDPRQVPDGHPGDADRGPRGCAEAAAGQENGGAGERRRDGPGCGQPDHDASQ